MKYSIDTSAILDGWRRYYPRDVFPAVWTHIEGLIDKGALRASEEVLIELEKRDDEVHEWAKERKDGMFVQIDHAQQLRVAAILKDHEKLVDTRRNRSAADPFVIALAEVGGCAVVTGEKATGSLDRPNIPDICKVRGVRCLGLVELFREQGWRFAR